MKQSKTQRGFAYIDFKDRYDKECSIQKSSLATEDCIWFGIDNPEPKILIQGKGWVEYPLPEEVSITTRMHLSVEQVKELIPILQRFVETGEVSLKDE